MESNRDDINSSVHIWGPRVAVCTLSLRETDRRWTGPGTHQTAGIRYFNATQTDTLLRYNIFPNCHWGDIFTVKWIQFVLTFSIGILFSM